MGTRHLILLFSLLVVALASCGDETNDPSSDVSQSEIDDSENQINTEKLVGTPFEGLTLGDSFPDNFFLCGDYRTEKIDSFPIKIFTAFLTQKKEETVKEGIELANDAMGFAAYELTDEWSNNNRVIYEVGSADGAIGRTYAFYMTFNGKIEAEKQAPDWAIVLDDAGPVTVAHELGHASGIRSHALIDYENDTILPLENDSIMSINGIQTDFTEYDFMMQRQGEIMNQHLGEVGDLVGTGRCGI